SKKASLPVDGRTNIRKKLRHRRIDGCRLPVGCRQRKKVDPLDASGGVVLKDTPLRVLTHDRSISNDSTGRTDLLVVDKEKRTIVTLRNTLEHDLAAKADCILIESAASITQHSTHVRGTVL